MTDTPDVSPWRRLIGTTLLSSLFVLPASLMAQDGVTTTADAADPLRLAAEDAVSCRELRDPDIRLACLDAAARRISEAIGSMNQGSMDQGSVSQGSIDQAGRKAEDPPIIPDAPDTPDAAVISVAPVAMDDSPVAPADDAPAVEAAEQPPTWADAPEPRQSYSEQAATPQQFEATIVRITRNNVGRHRFYTEDGAVWEQTQLVEVRAPKTLPAVAEIRRKRTGNPTIKFDVSSRSYRVRRIE